MSFNFDLKRVDGDVSFRTRYQTGIRVFPLRTKDLPSRVKQADARASDINVIVARYRKSGELPVANRAPMFADISVGDFKSSMDVMTAAQQSFDLLPARVRSAFGNDPARLLEALDNSSDPVVHQYLFDSGMFLEPPKAKETPVDKSLAKGARPPKAGAPKPDDVLSEDGE